MPAFGYTDIPEYLCEIGKKYYEKGDYASALHEFKKALILDPDNSLALKYIELMDQSQSPAPETSAPETPAPEIPAPETPAPEIPETEVSQPAQGIETSQDFDLSDQRQKEIERAMENLESPVTYTPSPPAEKSSYQTKPETYKQLTPEVLLLNSNLQDLRYPVEVEKDKSIILRGENITRFLDTQPNIVKIDRLNENEISVTGFDYGYTYVHVWDAKGRWTVELLCVPPKPQGLTLDEELRQEAQRAGDFKLRYSLDWSAPETGRRIHDLKRSSYTWNHWLTLEGQTPYGNLDSQVSVRTSPQTTDLSYFALGLTNGNLGSLNDFTIRGFDFSPELNNLVFSSPNLRGLMLSSPAFDKKIDYTVFWGREGGGRYAGLSPGLDHIRDSFLEGFNLDITPVEKQLWSLSGFHGMGSERAKDLNPNGYDLKFSQGFTNWKTGYEVAYDSQKLAHLFTANYSIPDFKLSTEFRDTAKDFHTMTGGGWRAGEVGVLTNMYYKPATNLEINTRLDVFQDRLYPNPKNEDWLNEDLNVDANYSFNQMSSLKADYSLQNELGRLSPVRYHNAGLGYYQSFNLIKRINAYLTYRHQDSMNFSAHGNDFVNEKVLMGMRTNVIGQLYYYANKEFNWLYAKLAQEHSNPTAFETGLELNSQILGSPFYGDFRLTYRDEEDTESALSFLSGEDYLEGYGEIAYRPNRDLEIYCSARIRNIWADNPNVTKRVDASFYAGLRYAWDTGVHWDPVGTVAGYAFKDYNFDGLRQKDEPAIENIKIILAKDRSQLTDVSGRYGFSKVRAKKVYVTLDTTTIPSGFVLTTPATKEVAISQSGTVEVNFGLASRTEIVGTVFEDVNANNKFDENDKGLKGVQVTLEDGTKAVSTETGRYSFNKAKVGKHTLKIELESVPSNYMPTIPIMKEIDISEGSTYLFNIPLKKLAD
jgi:tetratricopeptide (TPR) repeat protein